MTTRARLLAVAEAYAAARRLSLARVSTLCANDGKLLAGLRRGRDVTTARHDALLAWFAAHWPPGADWPPGVPRPVQTGTDA